MSRRTPFLVLGCIGILTCSITSVDAFAHLQQASKSRTTTQLYNGDTQEKKAYFVDDIPDAKVKVQVQVKEDESSSEPQEDEEAELSDLDARVLKSMLQDDKLDLKQEANMKKLLERGVAPKSAPTFEKQQDDDDSEFSSTLFKTLADTKLWKGLKRDAGNILESVGIFVANRIERDAKLLGAVGLFAWERAVRDVARALPASGTSGAAVGRAVRNAARQLGNSSSYTEMQQAPPKSLEELDNLYDELNTPMDEIKSVTQSIRDILKGESVSTASSGRSLRSVAPAGQTRSAERQKRAYRRRKISTLQQEKQPLNLQRAAGNVIDTAAEVRRELQVESSVPGYRSEGARKAIAAGAAETQRFLAAAKRDGWSKALFAPSREDVQQQETIRELVGAEDIEAVKVEVDAQAVSQLMEEQARIVDRLDLAIHDPGETWLTADVVAELDGVIDEDALREVVTAMILARDEWEEANYESLSASEMVERLREVKRTVDSITSLAASCAGMAGAECLSNVLYGQDEEGADSRPSLLTLDEVGPSIAAAVEVAESLPVVEESESYFVDNEVIHDDDVIERTVFAEVVSDGHDRTPMTVEPDVMSSRATEANEAYITDYDKQVMSTPNDDAAFEPDIRMVSAEVVSDDDFDSTVGAKRVAVAPDEVEESEKEPDVIAFFLLRSLDIVVLIIEKLFTSVLPGAFTIGSTASTRLADIAREGMGSKGWKKLDNTQSGAKRY